MYICMRVYICIQIYLSVCKCVPLCMSEYKKYVTIHTHLYTHIHTQYTEIYKCILALKWIYTLILAFLVYIFISSLHCHYNFFRNLIRCIIFHVMGIFLDVPFFKKFLPTNTVLQWTFLWIHTCLLLVDVTLR